MTKPVPQTDSPAPPRVTPVFLDGIEAGVARLLVEDEAGEWRTFHLPAKVLPEDAHEGSWIELAVRTIAPPPGYEGKLRRDKLGSSDDGGNLTL